MKLLIIKKAFPIITKLVHRTELKTYKDNRHSPPHIFLKDLSFFLGNLSKRMVITILEGFFQNKITLMHFQKINF